MHLLRLPAVSEVPCPLGKCSQSAVFWPPLSKTSRTLAENAESRPQHRVQLRKSAAGSRVCPWIHFEKRALPTRWDERGWDTRNPRQGLPRGLWTRNRPQARACSPGRLGDQRGPGPSSGSPATSRARGPPGAQLLRTGGAGYAAFPTDLRPARPSVRPPDTAEPDAEVSDFLATQ